MRNLCRYTVGATLCLLTAVAPAQQNHVADRLFAARSTYYTPTVAGLKSFHCSVVMDWKDILTRFGNKAISDDNPALVYLNSVKLGAIDDLHGKGGLEWVAPADPPENLKASVAQMRDGFSQTLGGFFQSWNAFMNGGMVPAPDSTTILSPAVDGFKLHSTSTQYVVDETFDKNSLLTNVHVFSKDMDVNLDPIYIDSPDGRIISVIQTSTRQPPTAPPINAKMSINYALGASFQLPETVTVDVKNVGGFVYNFSSCTVETSGKSSGKP